MIKLLVPFFLILAFLLSSSLAQAAQIPTSQYYDWGQWYKKSGQVLAESSVTLNNTNTVLLADVPRASGLLPDNPFYFLKTLGERFDLLLTFDNKSKTQKLLKYSEERLSEAKSLLESKNYAALTRTLQNYEGMIVSAKESVSKLNEEGFTIASSLLEKTAAKHSLVLEKLDLIVPEETRPNIQKSLQVSQETMDISSDLLGKSPLTEELKNRLESLEALGILPSNQLESIRSLPTRRDVRGRLNILVTQNILPISDIKKVDQAQIDLFPNDFLRVLEVRKIYEYEKLQSQQPDIETTKKIEDFAKSFKPGYFIPEELKKWWIPVSRLQELKSTLRPDLVSGSLFIKDTDEYQRLQSIFDSFKPGEEELREVDQWVEQNPEGTPPAHIQRLIALALNLGSTIEWKPPEGVLNQINLGYPPIGTEGKPGSNSIISTTPPLYCLNTKVKAKNVSSGKIETFPNTCLPQGWVVSYDDVSRAEGQASTFSRSLVPKEADSSPTTSKNTQSQTSQSVDVKPVGSSCVFTSHTKGVIDANGLRCNFVECETGWYNADSVTENGCESQSSTPSSSSVYDSSNSYVVSATKSCAAGFIQEANGVCHCSTGQTYDGTNKVCLGTASSSSSPSPSATPTCTRGMVYTPSVGLCQCPSETYYSPGENKCLAKKVCSGYTWDNNSDRWCTVPNADRGWMSWECNCENYSCQIGWYDKNASSTDGCEYKP